MANTILGTDHQEILISSARLAEMIVDHGYGEFYRDQTYAWSENLRIRNESARTGIISAVFALATEGILDIEQLRDFIERKKD